MKPKKINYKIEEPCHADWEQMKPESKGRFCESCSKTVVDFSSMSDFSIVNYLESNKHQSVCGRFAQDQLDKTYLWTKPHHQAFGFDLKAVALGLALSTFSALPSQAQNSTVIEQHDTISEPVVALQGAVAISYDHRDESFTSGKIKIYGDDYDRIQISIFDGSSKEILHVKPDKNGAFKIPLDWSKNPASIQVMAQGYYTETIYFSNHSSLANLKIELQARKMIKGKVAHDK